MASAGRVPLHIPKIADFFIFAGFPSGPWGRVAAGVLEPSRLTRGPGPSCVPGTSGVWLVTLQMASLVTDHSMDICLELWYRSV